MSTESPPGITLLNGVASRYTLLVCQTWETFLERYQELQLPILKNGAGITLLVMSTESPPGITLLVMSTESPPGITLLVMSTESPPGITMLVMSTESPPGTTLLVMSMGLLHHAVSYVNGVASRYHAVSYVNGVASSVTLLNWYTCFKQSCNIPIRNIINSYTVKLERYSQLKDVIAYVAIVNQLLEEELRSQAGMLQLSFHVDVNDEQNVV